MDHAISKQQRNRTRWTLVFLALLFTVPVVGPFFWTPKSFVNHGELVQPLARSLESIQLVDEDGNPAGMDAFLGKWTLLVIDQARCDPVCRRNLYNIRQVRYAQGRRMQRVQLAWIVSGGSVDETDREFMKDFPQVQIYSLPGGDPEALNELFRTQYGTPADQLQRVYFVDPLGNLVMSFGPDQDPGDMQKDLGRLLRVSNSGEKQI